MRHFFIVLTNIYGFILLTVLILSVSIVAGLLLYMLFRSITRHNCCT